MDNTQKDPMTQLRKHPLKRYFSIQFCSLSCTATISFYLLQIDLEVALFSSKQRKAEKIPSTAYQLHSRILWLIMCTDF